MWHVLFIVVLAVSARRTDAAEANFQFSKTTRQKCGPQRLTLGWTSKSKLNCAMVCREKFGNYCKCFMYNKLSKRCTPCSGILANSMPPNNTEGDLFFLERCNSYAEFRHYSEPLFPPYFAAYIDKYLNYTDATAVCDCLESRMFSPKTWDKYVLFLNITDLHNFDWVGLDDIQTEGKFVWALDGTEINSTLKLSTFAPGQPDNGPGSDEDCVQKWALGYGVPGRFNDANCSNLARFVCEKSQC